MAKEQITSKTKKEMTEENKRVLCLLPLTQK